MLRGLIRCGVCGRKMQHATIRDTVYYRCEYKVDDALHHPGLDHPPAPSTCAKTPTPPHSTPGSPAPSNPGASQPPSTPSPR
ncbi:recombinase zinc beta ribbon domain-containing protein [Streptomyces sp. NPDC086080]|uniref:zinc ribbon domain-containing protein n=1 Tax=Streptomyces sp. NPDC086080 TaxID=3365748 RepID=UPI0037CED1C5